MSTGREIRLIETPDGEWSAIDEATGVVSHGETKEEALANLDGAVSDPESEPLGDRLAGMAGDLDIDPVAAVRDVRERP